MAALPRWNLERQPASGKAMSENAGLRIEDYALIGDCYTAALVGLNGSIDWLCLPRFDSPACMAALVGTREHGRFLIGPASGALATGRRYLDGTMILETIFSSDEGEVALIDLMLPEAGNRTLIRIVEGRRGRLDMRMELVLRFDYGLTVPWVERRPGGNGLIAVAGPEAVVLRTPVPLVGEDFTTRASFTVSEGQRVPFVLLHGPSHLKLPPIPDAEDALYETGCYWSEWSQRCTYDGPGREAVLRSLLLLKALTFAPTGGMVAAATCSLPERIGGVRNWDYRFCWLRDAVLTLFAFMAAGYREEAQSWAHWLHRSVAGKASQMQIMYGIAGERRLDERELPWLPGYEGSAPVRTGNGAAGQLQLDVFGEVMSALHAARFLGLLPDGQGWALQRQMLDYLTTIWREPDDGLWESRGGRRHYTFSKVMAWVAFDRGIKEAERFGFDGDVAVWTRERDAIRAQVLDQGFDPVRNCFTQSYGAPALDASLLLLASVGFLEVDDPRYVGTVEAVRRELTVDGFVLRYHTHQTDDGLPPGEGVFLACSFWLTSALCDIGRREEATKLFERLLGLANDVGMLSEEYDPHAGRMTGNIPQAFSHVAMVMTAMKLAGHPVTSGSEAMAPDVGRPDVGRPDVASPDVGRDVLSQSSAPEPAGGTASPSARSR